MRRETGPSEKGDMHVGHGKGGQADGRDTETPNYGRNGWCPEPTSDTPPNLSGVSEDCLTLRW